MSTGVPSVLFVCVHNAGRSQMAAMLERRDLVERADGRFESIPLISETPCGRSHIAHATQPNTLACPSVTLASH
ncbi:hypothetical protein [Actinoallomurus sp. NPDC050550]|uniref:hypothetical protein n=1 Tax=Actinoallomurus sp. NPDC050550 TaxID=3154937 RepID=UPI0033CB1749